MLSVVRPTGHLAADTDDKEIVLVDDRPHWMPIPVRHSSWRWRGRVRLRVTRVVEIEEEIEIRQWTVETKQKRSFQTHLDDWPRVLPGVVC
jgi:hypothetical protein